MKFQAIARRCHDKRENTRMLQPRGLEEGGACRRIQTKGQKTEFVRIALAVRDRQNGKECASSAMKGRCKRAGCCIRHVGGIENKAGWEIEIMQPQEITREDIWRTLFAAGDGVGQQSPIPDLSSTIARFPAPLPLCSLVLPQPSQRQTPPTPDAQQSLQMVRPPTTAHALAHVSACRSIQISSTAPYGIHLPSAYIARALASVFFPVNVRGCRPSMPNTPSTIPANGYSDRGPTAAQLRLAFRLSRAPALVALPLPQLWLSSAYVPLGGSNPSEYPLAGMVEGVLGIEGRQPRTLTGKNTEARARAMYADGRCMPYGAVDEIWIERHADTCAGACAVVGGLTI
ncbi:hypothetical protein B0H13DRAFT_1914261 [Mycena leptocephala]|nr:hypothetical protein B0H13DRAFT_1914261 [Mycena leptocephala]